MDKYLPDETITISLSLRQAIADEQHSPRRDTMEFWKHLCSADLLRASDVPQQVPYDGPELERVTVESQGYKAALDLVPQNEVQRRKIQAIIDRGPTYESCVFFQKRGAL